MARTDILRFGEVCGSLQRAEHADARDRQPHRTQDQPRGTSPRRTAAPAPRRRGADAERARRRPLLEGVRLSDRARQDAPDARDDRVARRPPRRRRRLPRERRRDRRARPARRRARAGRGAVRGAAKTTRRRPRSSRSSAAARATGVPELQVRALVGTGLAKMRLSDHRAALELLNEARAIVEAESFSDVERADVLFRLGGCRYQLNSIQTALALLNEALGLAERSGPAVRRAEVEHPLLALALLAPAARLRGRARRHRARARAARGRRRPPHDRRRVLPGFARRRPRGPLGARAQLRRAGARGVRGARRPRPRQPAHEQPRRPQLPPRQDRRGDRAAQGGVRDRARDSDATPTPAALSPRSPRFISAPATSPRPRSRRGTRSSCSRAGSTTSTRSAARSSCSGAVAARAGPPRRGRGGVRRRRGQLRRARVRKPSRSRLGRARRSGRTARRPQTGGRAVPHRCRGSPGCSVLDRGGEVTT